MQMCSPPLPPGQAGVIDSLVQKYGGNRVPCWFILLLCEGQSRKAQGWGASLTIMRKMPCLYCAWGGQVTPPVADFPHASKRLWASALSALVCLGAEPLIYPQHHALQGDTLSRPINCRSLLLTAREGLFSSSIQEE